MPLTLTLRDSGPIPIEVFDVGVESLRGKTLSEIEQVSILTGNRTEPLAERFTVSGSLADDDTLIWSGDLRRVKGIAAGQRQGRVIVTGAAGMHLAAGLRGGSVVVEGDVGDWAGAEMRGGRLTIRGSAGRCLGGAYRGGLRGMTGGEILVHGDCGDEAGQLLRRGTIAVQGNAGAGVGFGMLAGTIVVGGQCGPLAVAGMKRGTLLCRQSERPLLPAFRDAGVCELVIVRLLIRHLSALGLQLLDDWQGCPLRRFSGDFTAGGRGEILWPVL